MGSVFKKEEISPGKSSHVEKSATRPFPYKTISRTLWLRDNAI